jgi:purine-cytosine permease-like protein
MDHRPQREFEDRQEYNPARQRPIRLFGREIPVPQSRILRIVLGVLLVLFGFLGFLPVLGFWMVPLGLLMLSYDIAAVRRLRRRVEVWWAARRRG